MEDTNTSEADDEVPGPGFAFRDDDKPTVEIGIEYQATCPDYIPGDERYSLEDKATEIWLPSDEISERDLDDFIRFGKETRNYNEEEALVMLPWHMYDLEKAERDLPNFRPVCYCWTAEDTALFINTFSLHGKRFDKIRSRLPHKEMGTIIHFYYY